MMSGDSGNIMAELDMMLTPEQFSKLYDHSQKGRWVLMPIRIKFPLFSSFLILPNPNMF